MKSLEISGPATGTSIPTLAYKNEIFRRLHDTIPYLIAGILFTFGSYQYLPSINDIEMGGWLFTSGSVCFLYGDLNEWLKLHIVEWFYDTLYKDNVVRNMGITEVSCNGIFQLSSNYWNSLLSVFSSILYLVGSVMFIPHLNVLVLGTIMYILASFVIFLSQIIKLYRSCCRSPPTGTPTLPVADEAAVKPNSFSTNTFQLSNLTEDIPGVGADVAAGLGGFAYMIGSYLFLPTVAVTEEDITHAAAWFITGGGLFFISGILLVYGSISCTNNSAKVNSLTKRSTLTVAIAIVE